MQMYPTAIRIFGALLALPPSVSAMVLGGDAIFINGFDRRPVAGEIVITEVMANPAAVPDTDGEWFEIVNTNPTDRLDISGCLVTNGADASSTLPPFEADSQQQVVFARNLDLVTNGNVHADATFGFSLPQSAGTLTFECDGAILDVVTWSNSSSGQSRSLSPESTDDILNDDSGNWCFPTVHTYNGTDFGTPGTANDECP